MFGQNPAIMPTILYPMALHLKDHLLNYYLVEAHNAVDQAQQKQLMPEEAQQQVEIIIKVQEFIQQQLGSFAQELAQISEASQQFKPEDPAMRGNDSMKIAELSAQIKQGEIQQRAERDNAQLQFDNLKLDTNSQLQQMKMQQTAEIERAKLMDKMEDRKEKAELQGLREVSETERNNIREMSETDRQNIREDNENARKKADLKARERMNNADNKTAKELAEMEMLADEKTSFTTGSGIDFDPKP